MKKLLICFLVLFSSSALAQSPPSNPAPEAPVIQTPPPAPPPPPASPPAPPPSSSSTTSAPVEIEILVDSSGSMNALVGSESQMDIAKKSLKQTLSTIPGHVPVALRAFAHRISKADKEGSCKDTELMVPFQPVNISALSTAVDSMKPNGYTPLAFALKTAAGDFLGKEAQYVIILLSDGEETCGGDPVAEVESPRAKARGVRCPA